VPGFTHFCTRSRKWGSFVIGRKTIKKRVRAKLLAIKISCAGQCTTPWRKPVLRAHSTALEIIEELSLSGLQINFVTVSSIWLGLDAARRAQVHCGTARQMLIAEQHAGVFDEGV
jgi:hypothetical protein